MDCITSIQKALDYLEEHLLEPVGYEDVAKQVFMSGYHFHRAFSMLTGTTVNEYLRSRRLSMAGQEIARSDSKVIDLAYRYGYDSLESFTKAFTRFHGVSPMTAKKSGVQLKLYNRLIIKVSVEGGSIMDYKIVEKAPFQTLCKVERFRNEITAEKGNREIPEFWNRTMASDAPKVFEKYGEDADVYGMCTPSSQESGCFQYGIGVRYSGTKVPDGYKLWQVKPILWAVFLCYGENETCIRDIWDRFYKEWLPGSGYNMVDDTDFELYPFALHPHEANSSLYCEVWIPICKK